ncbi:MAG TPA: hypothetical protein VH116_05930 [Gemmatimonadales bacterium]|jgi:hypothetical protein|nr:hypothetical protein [Gemmatimonadales bacterium]
MDATPLAGWDNFYVIIGSSAGGLTGLTFVVIVLIRESAQGVQPTGLGAFVTPTIVHFCGVLALAAFMSMPHQSAGTLSAGLALGGLAGLIYGCLIGVSMYRIGIGATRYVPVREDWIWNVIVPTLVYAALVVMAALIWDRLTRQALYGVAVLALALLFIGIRNAWDLAVWMSVSRPQNKESAAEQSVRDGP